MSYFRKISRLLWYLEKCGMYGAGFCLFAIMIIVMIDITMRYVFNAPFTWSYDVISMYLMVVAFFLALSSTFRNGGHITIDFFTGFMTPNVRRFAAIICDIAMMPVLLIMIVTSLDATIAAIVGHEVVSGSFNRPVWLSTIFVPLGIGMLFVRVFIYIVDLAVGNETGQPGQGSETPQDEVL